jgi:hypothetical protein
MLMVYLFKLTSRHGHAQYGSPEIQHVVTMDVPSTASPLASTRPVSCTLPVSGGPWGVCMTLWRRLHKLDSGKATRIVPP